MQKKEKKLPVISALPVILRRGNMPAQWHPVKEHKHGNTIDNRQALLFCVLSCFLLEKIASFYISLQ